MGATVTDMIGVPSASHIPATWVNSHSRPVRASQTRHLPSMPAVTTVAASTKAMSCTLGWAPSLMNFRAFSVACSPKVSLESIVCLSRRSFATPRGVISHKNRFLVCYSR
jgi:hypothetical protein